MTEDRYVARRARLLAEIDEEALVVLRADELHDPADVDAVAQLVVDEVLHARHIQPHEGRRPPYGCLIVEDANAVTGRAVLADTPDGADPGSLETIRAYANGQDTFAVRDPAGNTRVVVVDPVDELALVRLCRQLKAVSVQRLENGNVAVGTRTTITTDAGYDWTKRDHGRRLMRPVLEVLGTHDEATSLAGIAELLDFCVHYLSPNGFGATFVLALGSADAERLGQSITNDGHLVDFDLDAFDPNHQRALGSLLANVDGACMLQPNGRVHMYEAILKNSAESEMVPQHSGTRHTSARRFSYDHRDSLVIVVSADGHTTVFYGGAAIERQTATGTRLVPWNLRYVPSEAAKMTEQTDTATCASCDSEITVTFVTSLEHNQQHTINCPVCGREPLLTVTALHDYTSARPRRT